MVHDEPLRRNAEQYYAMKRRRVYIHITLHNNMKTVVVYTSYYNGVHQYIINLFVIISHKDVRGGERDTYLCTIYIYVYILGK